MVFNGLVLGRSSSAKDDAAGQAIANRMTSQITGLNQAQRNANDGISVAQTAEGALNQVNDNLQRIRELTVQAQNATNSGEDLTSIQAEIDERILEINRISEQTDFNGTKVLSETKGLVIQVGANDNEIITVNLEKIDRVTLGIDTFSVDGAGSTPNKAATQADLDAAVAASKNVSKVGDQYFMTTANTAVSASDVLASVPETIGLTVGGTTTANDLAKALGFATAAGTVALADGLKSNGDGGFTFDVAGATAAEVQAFIQPGAGEGSTAATYTAGGVSHNILLNDNGSVTDSSGQEMFITAAGELTYDNVGGTLSSATVANLTTAINASDADDNPVTLKLESGTTVSNASGGSAINVTNVTISSADLATAIDAESLEVTTTTTAARDGAAGVDAIVITGDTTGTLAVKAGGNDVYKTADGALTQAVAEKEELFVRDNGNITTVAADQIFMNSDGSVTKNAETAGTKTENPLDVLDNALKMVDTLRSNLGAIQNRFESAITNLQTNSTNLQAARSRIEDADYAVEVANMSKNQILQQAGTSVLAQANQIPQGVLSLLR